jgi:hypothetical protein
MLSPLRSAQKTEVVAQLRDFCFALSNRTSSAGHTCPKGTNKRLMHRIVGATVNVRSLPYSFSFFNAASMILRASDGRM